MGQNIWSSWYSNLDFSEQPHFTHSWLEPHRELSHTPEWNNRKVQSDFLITPRFPSPPPQKPFMVQNVRIINCTRWTDTHTRRYETVLCAGGEGGEWGREWSGREGGCEHNFNERRENI